MSTQALKATSAPRLTRKPEDACPVALLMRQAAACRRLLSEEHVSTKIRKLPVRDRSDMTCVSIRKRVLKRLRALETLAGEMQPTSLVGVAYQLLLAMNWSCMDDEIDAAVDKQRLGAADDLLERADTVQNTVLSAYRGLRPLIHDADLVVVEAPHRLRGWKPNQTVSALLEAQG